MLRSLAFTSKVCGSSSIGPLPELIVWQFSRALRPTRRQFSSTRPVGMLPTSSVTAFTRLTLRSPCHCLSASTREGSLALCEQVIPCDRPPVRCGSRWSWRSRSASCFRSCRSWIQHRMRYKIVPYEKSHCGGTRRYQCCAG